MFSFNLSYHFPMFPFGLTFHFRSAPSSFLSSNFLIFQILHEIIWIISGFLFDRGSLDYEDDRYYIANNIRNSHYAMHPNPSPVQNPYVQKPVLAVSNFPSNRLLSQMKRTSVTGSPTDPKQDVGLPRSSIV